MLILEILGIGVVVGPMIFVLIAWWSGDDADGHWSSDRPDDFQHS